MTPLTRQEIEELQYWIRHKNNIRQGANFEEKYEARIKEFHPELYRWIKKCDKYKRKLTHAEEQIENHLYLI